AAVRAARAEAEMRETLRRSYLAQAQAGRWSRRAGSRIQGLKLLKKAAEIRPSLELRNEAIACMTLPDIQISSEWKGYPESGTFGSFDSECEAYSFGDSEGVIHICHAGDGAELARIPGFRPPYQTIEFSPDGRELFVACG